jgi:hypothetical protein
MVRQLVGQAAQLLQRLGFRQTPLYKEPTRPSGLAECSFLLLNRSAQGMEGIFEAILNAMREGRPMTTMGTQFGMGFDPTGMQFGGGMGGGMPGMFGGGMGGMGGMGMGAPGGGQQEKFLSAIFPIIAQAAPHVIPLVMQAFRKEYEPQQQWGQQQPYGYGGGPGGEEKGIGDLFRILAQQAPQVLPQLLQALQQRGGQSFGMGGNGIARQ